jgi:hypothetical protein
MWLELTDSDEPGVRSQPNGEETITALSSVHSANA